ncbi:MAG: hypothetical protein ACHQ50_08090 [Fimbriimonadales bacterium]
MRSQVEHTVKAKRNVPKWQRDMTNQFAKRALVGISFMFVAVAIPILAKQFELKGPAWEATLTADALLLGLGWYAIYWPRRTGRVGIRVLVVLWILTIALWIAVILNSYGKRAIVMESMAVALTLLSAEMTLRQVVTPESGRSSKAADSDGTPQKP